MGGIVTSNSIRVAGDKMDDAIVQYVKRRYNLFIGERTAEQVKIKLGNAFPADDDVDTMEIKGRDLVSGIPKTLEITVSEVKEALTEPLNDIVDAVRITLEKTPPELASDIVDKGIVMTGGGSLLKNIDVLLRNAVNLPITIVDDPLSTVVMGSGKLLDDGDLLREVALSH
jgi:rod shape-determining protein MreB